MSSKANNKFCTKCSKEIKTKDYLKCKQCSSYYDVLCTANVSVKLFDLMSKDGRSKWVCHRCRNPSPIASKRRQKNTGGSSSGVPSTVSVTRRDNVTLRKPKPATLISPLTRSPKSESSFDSQDHDDTACSLPNLSTTDDLLVLELKSQVASLSLQLASAHDEIERLNCTITEIMKTVQDNQNKIDLYRKILGENGNLHKATPKKTTKRNSNHRMSDTLFSCTAQEKAAHVINQADIFYTPESAVQSSPNRNQTISESHVDAPVSSNKNENSLLLFSETQDDTGCNKYSSPGAAVIVDTEIHVEKRKVLIFSDNRCVFVRRYLQNHLGASHIVTAFVKSGASSDKLLESSIPLCSDFTKKDYVIILCGQNDKSIVKLQASLYSYIERLSHTNVLLSDVYFNKNLHVPKITEMFNLICIECKEWSSFISPYGKSLHSFRSRKLKLGLALLNRILSLNYKYDYYSYTNPQSKFSENESLTSDTCKTNSGHEECAFFRP